MDAQDRLPTPAGEGGVPEVVVVTGMSGAGRSTVGNVMEDHGWYVIDNLPVSLMPDLLHVSVDRGGDLVGDGRAARIGIVLDVRAQGFETLTESIRVLRERGWRTSSSSSRPPTRLSCGASRACAGPTPCRDRAGCSTPSSASARCSPACGPAPRRSSTPRASTSTSSAARSARSSRGRPPSGCGWPCCPSASSTACRSTPTSSSTCASCPTPTGCRSCARTPAGRPRSPSTSCRSRARPSSSSGSSTAAAASSCSPTTRSSPRATSPPGFGPTAFPPSRWRSAPTITRPSRVWARM